MDHRGTPTSPGLVVTLVPDDHLVGVGLREPSDPPSKTFGAIYRIPESEVQEVLADLDHREKGGYTRCIVDVHCHDHTGEGKEELLQALLYTGMAGACSALISRELCSAISTKRKVQMQECGCVVGCGEVGTVTHTVLSTCAAAITLLKGRKRCCKHCCCR